MFKIVRVDNYGRESRAEVAVAQFIRSRDDAVIMRDALCADPRRSDDDFYRIDEQGSVLWRGMADLVGDPEPVVDPSIT